MSPDIAYLSYFTNDGISEAARDNALALRWAGFRVANQRVTDGEKFGPEPFYIHHYCPNEPLRSNANKRVAYWAWECEGAVSNQMMQSYQQFDQIWTPSEYCKEVFEDRMPGVDVKVVPHAVRPCKGKPSFRQVGDEFRVLLIFDVWSRVVRKNPLGALRAFKKAFGNDKKCKLIIKACNLNHPSAETFLPALKDVNCEIISSYLPHAELEKLMLSCHCVLSLHRSEGFGFNLAKALSYGVPLVATNYGGSTSWSCWGAAHQVDYSKVEVGDEEGYFPPQGIWAEPDVDDAAEKLRWVYENPLQAYKRAVAGRRVSDFSFQRLSDNLSDLVF